MGIAYLEELIRLIVAGDSIETSLRAGLSDDAIVKTTQGRNNTIKSRAKTAHARRVVEPKIYECLEAVDLNVTDHVGFGDWKSISDIERC